jgi:hypothetical protein
MAVITSSDFTVDTTNKLIKYINGSGTIFTVKELYTYVLDYVDEESTIQHQVPMSAQTPSEYKLINGWFIDDASTQKLSGGAITTEGWTHPTNTTGIRILTLATIADVTDGDIGTAVAGATTGDTGKLLAYDTTLKKLWVRADAADDLFDNASENITVNGTLAGAMGGAVSVTGETIYSNIFTLGTLVTGTTLDVYQNDAQITPWWIAGHIDVLVKVKEASVEIDSGNLTILARLYSTLYDHYVIDASSGRNPVPLAAFADSNNTTAEGTVGAAPYTDLTFNFGSILSDVNGDTTTEPYDVEINCSDNTLEQVYEYLKYVTRSSSAVTFADYGSIPGEFYTAVGDIRFTYTAGSGTFAEGNAVIDSTSGATGYITSRIASSSTLVIRNTHGTFTNGDSINNGAGVTGTINSVPSSIAQSKQAPFGTFAGGRFFGARGVLLTNVAAVDANSYELIDSTGTTRTPPVTVNLTINITDAEGTAITNACEITIVKTSDDSVLYNTENVTTGTVTYDVTSNAGVNTYVNVMNVTGYQAKTVNNFALPTSTPPQATVIQLDEDRFYSNPT